MSKTHKFEVEITTEDGDMPETALRTELDEAAVNPMSAIKDFSMRDVVDKTLKSGRGEEH